MSGTITITDVARRAGVSICTVSKVLAGGEQAGRYSASCRRRAEGAAAATGYRAHHLARALRSKRCGTIGVLAGVPLTGEPSLFSTAVLAAADRAVRLAGRHTMLIGRHGIEDSHEAEDAFAERRIDGLIVCQPVLPPKILRRIEALEQPIVLVQHEGATALPRVELDPVPGIDAAIAHLADLGHRRLAWLGPDLRRRVPAATARSDAARAAAERHGMAFSAIAVGIAASPGSASEIDAARSALAGSLAVAGNPGALLCYHDIMALGAYAALGAAGLRPGIDTSVIGFDDLLATTAYPPMSSVSHAIPALGETAVALLVGMIETPTRRAELRRHVALAPSSLVLRASTAAPVSADPP